VSELPRGWVETSVGDLVDLIRGVSYEKADASPNSGDGRLPILRATNIDEQLDFDDLVYVPSHRVSESQRLKVGDIVIAASSGSKSVVGKAAQLSMPWVGSFGAFCMGIRPKLGNHPEFLGYYFQSERYRRTVSKLAAGSNINNLKREHISTLGISLPPFSEQGRIVEKLDELLSDLDAGIAALERARANLKRYRASILKAAVEGRLTAAWRAAHPDAEHADKLLERILAERRKRWEDAQLARYAERGQTPPNGWMDRWPDPFIPDTSATPQLPDTWRWVGLDQILVQPLSNGRSVPTATDGFPVLRLTALKRGSVDLDERKIGAWKRDEAEPFFVQAGDFLIARGNGSLRLVGRGGLARHVDTEVAFPDTMIRARPAFEARLSDYLAMVWNSSLVREQIEKVARTSAGIYKVAQSDLENICIPIPSSAEIAEIVARVDEQLSALDRNADAIDIELTRASRLRQSILKHAFEGKLVPQDPNDEPASTLLDRLRAARAAAMTSPKVSARKSSSREKRA